MSLDLSIIIVNWNTRDLLAACLRSLVEENRSNPESSNLQPSASTFQLPVSSIETFVIDNASTDGSAGFVQEHFPWVKLIENAENVGFARANNQALALSRGNYVLLLNSDTVVQPGALRNLVQALESNPAAGASGPQMVSPDGSMQNSYGKLPSVWDEIVGPYWQDRLIRRAGKPGTQVSVPRDNDRSYIVTERVSFACVMIRRQALEQVGPLDDEFVFYSEDYDWFKRLKNADWQVLFCPKTRVIHHWGASSSKRSDWSLHQLYRSKRLYMRKHHGLMAERMLRVGLIVRFVAKALAECLFWPWQRQEALRRWRQQMGFIQRMLRPLQRAGEVAS